MNYLSISGIWYIIECSADDSDEVGNLASATQMVSTGNQRKTGATEMYPIRCFVALTFQNTPNSPDCLLRLHSTSLRVRG